MLVKKVNWMSDYSFLNQFIFSSVDVQVRYSLLVKLVAIFTDTFDTLALLSFIYDNRDEQFFALSQITVRLINQ